MNKENVRKLVEEDLSNYPFWLLSERMPGLGSPTHWDKKGYSGTSSVEYSLINDERIAWKIKIIELVIHTLDERSKKIIETRYFRDRDDFCIIEIIEDLNISKTTLYALRNRALDKFAVALRYMT